MLDESLMEFANDLTRLLQLFHNFLSSCIGDEQSSKENEYTGVEPMIEETREEELF